MYKYECIYEQNSVKTIFPFSSRSSRAKRYWVTLARTHVSGYHIVIQNGNRRSEDKINKN